MMLYAGNADQFVYTLSSLMPSLLLVAAAAFVVCTLVLALPRGGSGSC